MFFARFYRSKSCIPMAGLLICLLVATGFFCLSEAQIHSSNMINYKKEHLVFSTYKSFESLSLCNQTGTKSNCSLFGSHQMPDGAVLDLCLGPSGRICCEFLLSAEVNSNTGLEVLDLERELLGAGAHRELKSSITIKHENIETCHMVIIERLPSGVFADMFELEGLVAHGVYEKVVIYGDHNLELPALHSSESMVVIHKSFISESEHLLNAEVWLPLHARYPPLSFESHVAVDFKFPILLFQCVQNGGNASDINVDFNEVEGMAWTLLTKKESSMLDSIELQWLVPTGNPQHSGIVAAITACTSLSGVVILWVVSKYSYQSQKMKVT